VIKKYRMPRINQHPEKAKTRKNLSNQINLIVKSAFTLIGEDKLDKTNIKY
jgi:hypothetical protein